VIVVASVAAEFSEVFGSEYVAQVDQIAD